MVPVEETVAVRAAATGFTLSITNPPKLLMLILEWSSSYSKNCASSTKMSSLSLVDKLPIILAVGKINGSIESLALDTILPLIILSTFCFLQFTIGLNVFALIPAPVYISVSNVSDVVIPITVLSDCATSPAIEPTSIISPAFNVSWTSTSTVSGFDPPVVPL